MEKNNKTKFIKMIDHYIGEANLEEIDNALEFLNQDDHKYDEKFIKFVLGYTMIYDRDLKSWKSLHNKYYSDT